MKLYYRKGTCSLAVHMLLCARGDPFRLIKVDHAHQTEDGQDYHHINAKGYVPALILKDGRILTETAAILLYLSEENLNPDKTPNPKEFFCPRDRFERYLLASLLVYIATEIHKTHGPLFAAARAKTPPPQDILEKIVLRLTWIESQLGQQPFLLGESPSAADLYLFVTSRWSRYHRIDFMQFPRLRLSQGRLQTLPFVQEALLGEGIALETL